MLVKTRLEQVKVLLLSLQDCLWLSPIPQKHSQGRFTLLKSLSFSHSQLSDSFSGRKSRLSL